MPTPNKNAVVANAGLINKVAPAKIAAIRLPCSRRLAKYDLRADLANRSINSSGAS